MNNKLENILQSTECISPEDIKNYLDNTLSSDSKYKIETHLNECEFCNEAIEGFELVDSEFVINGTNEINSKIDKKFYRGFNLQYLIAAASICVILFLGSIFILKDTSSNKELSIQSESLEEKLTEDKLAPAEIENEVIVEEVEETEVNPETVSNNLEEEVLDKEMQDEGMEDILENVESHTDYYNDEELDLPNLEKVQNVDIVGAENENSLQPEVDLLMSSNSLTNEDAGSAAQEPKIASTRSYEFDDYDNLSEIEYSNMLALVQANVYPQQEEVLEEVEVTSKKKKESAYSSNNIPVYTNNNVVEIEKQFLQVRAGDYQKSLDELNFQITKDVWTNDESSTLKWLKAICELRLNLSAEETLRGLKKYKNPYQEEAKKIYNELY